MDLAVHAKQPTKRLSSNILFYLYSFYVSSLVSVIANKVSINKNYIVDHLGLPFYVASRTTFLLKTTCKVFYILEQLLLGILTEK